MALSNLLELPVIIYNNKEQEITNRHPDECELIECVRKIKPERIESYQEAIPTSDFREDNKIWTSVTMESGDNFIVNMPLAQFESLINEKS